ncbi:putative acyltransferase [Trypanosoma vivax]|nr:putative acyltransferase [Trypanosoma vivax]
MVLLRLRWCPTIVMRIWFSMCILLVIVPAYIVCGAVNAAAKMNWMSKRRSESISCVVSYLLLGKVLLTLSPHIRVKVMKQSLGIKDFQDGGVMCACHTSFFDTLLFLSLASLQYMHRAKALAKSALWKVPLLGTVVEACGHLPVYFTSPDVDSFGVDKEKQAVISVITDEFLTSQGNLCIFPEGVMNRTPEVLRDFRFGTFNLILRHGARVYYMAHCGCDRVWPPSLKGLPGFPADIYVYFGSYEYAKDTTAKELAAGLRQVMQKHLDNMIEQRRLDAGHGPSKTA